jgi:hypothetical protein
VLVLLLAVAIAGVAVAFISIALGRGRRFDDVERFHRARQMTTEWARSGVSSPFIAPQPNGNDARESVER